MAAKPFETLRQLDDADLDPYEFRLMMHYWRVGTCWETLRTTSDKCKMSLGKTKSTRDGLVKRGFIKWQDAGNGKMGIVVCSPHEQAQQLERSPDEQSSPHEQECSPHEQKVVESVHDMNAILSKPNYLNSQEEEERDGDNDPVMVLKNYFTQTTGILPTRSNVAQDWEMPIRLWLNADDIDVIKDKISRAWAIALEKGFRISSPRSLNNTMVNLKSDRANGKQNDFAQAWQTLQGYMASHGADRKPELSPEIDALVRKAGGWHRLCMMNQTEAQNRLRSFFNV